jgi:hypothetical protein
METIDMWRQRKIETNQRAKEANMETREKKKREGFKNGKKEKTKKQTSYVAKV